MSLTSDLKVELAGIEVNKPDQKFSETVALLRFAGGLHLVSRRIVIEAEVDSAPVMERLNANLEELFGVNAQIIQVSSGGIRKTSRYVIRVVTGAESLARTTGLIDKRGMPLRGLPPEIVGGSQGAALAGWKGALMARGSLMEPERGAALEVTSPGPEAGLALVGLGRRVGIVAKTREVRGIDRVVLRDGDMIHRLLTDLGATATLAAWQRKRETREMRGSVNRLANFDDANLRRSARAAVAAAARVERAFEILGDDIPDHLIEAGELRIKYKGASLEELGQQADPPLTKDAIAGRIRRLLAMADKKASEKGCPDTEMIITSDLLPGE
ncbi:MAG: DNA-binding protein WhiA [Actinomycetaceae bacterium]|nr:DNA-binding protein WhiA [Actinomycetaceae bacterium]